MVRSESFLFSAGEVEEVLRSVNVQGSYPLAALNQNRLIAVHPSETPYLTIFFLPPEQRGDWIMNWIMPYGAQPVLPTKLLELLRDKSTVD